MPVAIIGNQYLPLLDDETPGLLDSADRAPAGTVGRVVNRLGSARDALVQAIAPVLNGRTYPYPPSPQQANVAPAVWIDQADGFRDDDR